MSRRNRAAYPAWDNLWAIFCPWVVEAEDDNNGSDAKSAVTVSKPKSKPRSRKSCLLALLAFGLIMSGQAFAENDYGDFAKKPNKKPVAVAAQDNVQPQAGSATQQVQNKPDEKPHLILASLNTAPLAKIPTINYPSLFGSHETRYEDLSPFTKWSGVLSRFRQTFEASMQASNATRNWMNFLKAAKELDKEDQVKAVNTYMNRVKFIADKDNYGASDYWATPMEFMARGGDCEDYAIAKYVSLRALGFNEKQLRMAIVYDQEMRMPHAILIVYDKNDALVLDNQTPDIKQASNIKRYQPIYSINQLAWWRH